MQRKSKYSDKVSTKNPFSKYFKNTTNPDKEEGLGARLRQNPLSVARSMSFCFSSTSDPIIGHAV